MLTKVDMLQGHSAYVMGLNMLKGEHFPLRLGYVATKNRSNEEVDGGMTVFEGRKREIDWFASTEPFKTEWQFNPELFGIQSLTNKLQPLLNAICKAKLPDIENEIDCMLNSKNDALAKLGKKPPTSQ